MEVFISIWLLYSYECCQNLFFFSFWGILYCSWSLILFGYSYGCYQNQYILYLLFLFSCRVCVEEGNFNTHMPISTHNGVANKRAASPVHKSSRVHTGFGEGSRPKGCDVDNLS